MVIDFRDRLIKLLDEREEWLLDAMGNGIPYHEYIGFVGRRRELVRTRHEIMELYEKLFDSEEEEIDDEL